MSFRECEFDRVELKSKLAADKEWSIYHNPRCSKSRKALELLEDRGIDPHVVLYMKSPPSVETLQELCDRLGTPPKRLLRTHEPLFAELNGASMSDELALEAMSRHPQLIKRPIVLRGDRAILAIPPERALELVEPAD